MLRPPDHWAIASQIKMPPAPTDDKLNVNCSRTVHIAHACYVAAALLWYDLMNKRLSKITYWLR